MFASPCTTIKFTASDLKAQRSIWCKSNQISGVNCSSAVGYGHGV